MELCAVPAANWQDGRLDQGRSAHVGGGRSEPERPPILPGRRCARVGTISLCPPYQRHALHDFGRARYRLKATSGGYLGEDVWCGLTIIPGCLDYLHTSRLRFISIFLATVLNVPARIGNPFASARNTLSVTRSSTASIIASVSLAANPAPCAAATMCDRVGTFPSPAISMKCSPRYPGQNVRSKGGAKRPVHDCQLFHLVRLANRYARWRPTTAAFARISSIVQLWVTSTDCRSDVALSDSSIRTREPKTPANSSYLPISRPHENKKAYKEFCLSPSTAPTTDR
jgi:hypothetical protein